MQWYRDGEIIDGATATTLTPVVSGEYSVVAYGSSCQVSSDPVLFAITDVEGSEIHDFTIYPNPTRSKFIVKLPRTVPEGDGLTIKIYNMQGLLVGEFETPNKQEGVALNATNFASGLYTLQIQTSKRLFENRLIRE
jgi:hypothetical protein